MAVTARITSKGQITLPKQARQALGSDVVEVEIAGGEVRLRPVKSVAGALRGYAREAKPLSSVRDEVWEEVARDRKG